MGIGSNLFRINPYVVHKQILFIWARMAYQTSLETRFLALVCGHL